MIEPRLTWAFVSPSSQKDNPLYIPATRVPQSRVRQLSLENVLLDPADRVAKANRLRLSFANRYYRPGNQGGTDYLWADFTLSAEYDFAQNEWGSILLDGHAYPWNGPQTRFAFGYDVENGRIDEAMIDMSTALPYRASASVRYRYLRRIPRFFEAFRSEEDFEKFERGFMRVNQFDFSVRLPLAEVAASIPLISRFTLIYALSYSFEEKLRLGNRGGIEYVSKCKCWAAGLDIREDRVRGVEIGFRYTLLGLGDDQLGGSILDEGIGNLFGAN
jgi:lipopolysaccharide assembly outer membrane protein LptD (OstA)